MSYNLQSAGEIRRFFGSARLHLCFEKIQA